MFTINNISSIVWKSNDSNIIIQVIEKNTVQYVKRLARITFKTAMELLYSTKISVVRTLSLSMEDNKINLYFFFYSCIRLETKNVLMSRDKSCVSRIILLEQTDPILSFLNR